LGFQSILKLIGLVRRICRERKPALVIAWPFGLSHWITLGARLSGVKSILAHCGNPPGEGFEKKYLHTYLCVYLGLLFGNRIIACSQFVCDQYRQILFTGSLNLHVVHNALSVGKFLAPPDLRDSERSDVSMVGYLEEARDHRTLLKAWKIIERTLVEVKLNIIGDGRLRQEVELLAKELSLKNVIFTGQVDNVEKFLWRTKVYAFSTIREGFGTTLLEALAAGCSVVATDVPACREVLKDGKYGILVPSGDPERLAQAILGSWNKLGDKQSKRDQIAYAGQFTPERMVKKYLAIVTAAHTPLAPHKGGTKPARRLPK
jgi:glycosyltransferase involved in cell wall biosynthesis